MIAQQLRNKKRKLVVPRDIDRYPRNVKVDFRNCSAKTLKNYVAHYGLKIPSECSTEQMASAVAKHFQGDLNVTEEEVVPNFVQYVLEYNGGNIATATGSSKTRSRKTVTTVTLQQKEVGILHH